MPKAIGNCVEYLTRCPDSREAAAVACWTGQSLRLPSSRCQRTAQLHVWPAPTSEHRTTTASMQLHTLTYTHTDHIGLPSFSHTPFTRSSKRPANVFKIHTWIAARLLDRVNTPLDSRLGRYQEVTTIWMGHHGCVQYIITNIRVNSAFHPPWVHKLSINLPGKNQMHSPVSSYK